MPLSLEHVQEMALDVGVVVPHSFPSFNSSLLSTLPSPPLIIYPPLLIVFQVSSLCFCLLFPHPLFLTIVMQNPNGTIYASLSSLYSSLSLSSSRALFVLTSSKGGMFTKPTITLGSATTTRTAMEENEIYLVEQLLGELVAHFWN
ncbi:hypothetical protein Fmac_021477 [Flemingia macrophylla]|uniref:Uncharacterized protein n=1 Tax=Flemingia macrophylla TaxID=520843 RepID=A0ABD1LX03_9FABA